MKDISTIVVSGSIAIDRIMNFAGSYRDHLQSEKLDSLSISVFLESLIDARGGVGANICYSLALLGEHPILLGSAGTDAHSYMESLARVGVDIRYTYESTLPTASFNVITDSEQNQVGGFYTGAMFDSDTLLLTPWHHTQAIIVVSPHDPKAMKRQVEECRSFGLRLCYDVGQQVHNLPGEDMAAGIDAAHILIVNDYEMTIISQKTGRSIPDIKAQVPIVITTLGKNGSVVEGKDVPEAIKVGIVPPTQVADPTGAGDAYRAGFLYGFARSWPLKQCAQLGAVCGTYAIEAIGTQNHTYTFDELALRYNTTFNEILTKVTKG